MTDYCIVCGDTTPEESDGEYREASVSIDKDQRKEIKKQHCFEVWVCNSCIE